MEWQATYFGVLVAKTIATPEAYALLDRYLLESWSAGGCAVLAQALSRLTSGAMYALVDKKTGQVEHFVTRVDSVYVDSDGAYTSSGIVAKFEALERRPGMSLRKVTQKLWAQVSIADDDDGAILCPPGAVDELVEMLDDAVVGFDVHPTAELGAR